MIDVLECVGYFASFWLFMFKRRYRIARIQEWREGGWFERTFMLIEASISCAIGAGLPGALVWLAMR